MARKKDRHLDYKKIHPFPGFVRSLSRPRTADNIPLSQARDLGAGTLFPNYIKDHNVSMDVSGHIYTDAGELLL